MLSIRGVARMFKSIDKNGNRQIDMEELYYGLRALGLTLTEEEAFEVLKVFDKDKNGNISFDEFLRALKGDLNNFRIELIKKAYQRLDVN